MGSKYDRTAQQYKEAVERGETELAEHLKKKLETLDEVMVRGG